MPPFLLIHGSCHGAWCWRDVLPFFSETADARAIDLPGAGDDKTPVSQVTLELYAEAILDNINSPAVLVGHSMAGFPVSLVAERAPEKIARLVFVCAYAPVSGRSLADMRRAGPSQPLLDAIETAPDRQSFTFRPDMLEASLYHDCPPGTLDHARTRLTPQAIRPQETAMVLGENYARIPKRYIRCADDRAIPPDYQAMMSAGWADRVDLPCSHSPFFAMPEALFRAIR